MADKKLFLCKIPQYTVVGTPAKSWRDGNGNPKKSPRVAAVFEGGELETDDPKVIKIARAYMAKHPDIVTEVDKEKLKKERRIRKEVAERVEKETRAEMDKATKKQDKNPSGRDDSNDDPIPGEYTEAEIDKADIKNAHPKDMNKKQLFKYAKVNKISLARKDRKDLEKARKICVAHFEIPKPDLDDESGEGK